MNDPWMVVAIILLFVAIVLSMYLFNRTAAASKAYKSEKVRQENENMRRDYFMREGMPVNAKVTSVVLHEDHEQYEVFASWRSRETGRVFNFHEIYMFPLCADQGFHPRISRGDFIAVWAILDQPANFIEQHW